MTSEIQNKLSCIVNITRYFLNTQEIMWSSGDNGYDKVINAYCFFSGNLVEYKTYYIHSDFVKYETPLANAVKLCNLIRGNYDT